MYKVWLCSYRDQAATWPYVMWIGVIRINRGTVELSGREWAGEGAKKKDVKVLLGVK